MADEPKCCPLCLRETKKGKASLLNGHPICNKCYYAFANRRQIAFLIDRVLWQIGIVVLFFCVGVALGLMHVRVSGFEARIIDLTTWPLFLLFFFKDGFGGASIGKRICGVRVVDCVTFKPAGFSASFRRNLPLLIPFVPLVIAFTLAKGKRLGDKWANTLVIWTKYENSWVFGGNGCCEKCQYDLFNNTSGVCPECGTPVSEQNKIILAKREAQEAQLVPNAV